jgi:hemerythrin
MLVDTTLPDNAAAVDPHLNDTDHWHLQTVAVRSDGASGVDMNRPSNAADPQSPDVAKRFLVWRDEWTLNVDFMDEDCRVMAALLNQIARDVSCCVGGGWKAVVGSRLMSRLDALGAYAREHFQREEQVMRKTDYPAFAQHKAEHDLLLAEYTVMLRDIRGAGPRSIETSMLDALKQWLIGHVLNDDKALAKYLLREPATGDRARPMRSSPSSLGWSELLFADEVGGTAAEAVGWR